MYVLSELDENFDNVFSTIINKILTQKITIDDAKALLGRRTTYILPLPSVNMSVKDSDSSSTS